MLFSSTCSMKLMAEFTWLKLRFITTQDWTKIKRLLSINSQLRKLRLREVKWPSPRSHSGEVGKKINVPMASQVFLSLYQETAFFLTKKQKQNSSPLSKTNINKYRREKYSPLKNTIVKKKRKKNCTQRIAYLKHIRWNLINHIVRLFVVTVIILLLSRFSHVRLCATP